MGRTISWINGEFIWDLDFNFAVIYRYLDFNSGYMHLTLRCNVEFDVLDFFSLYVLIHENIFNHKLLHIPEERQQKIGLESKN